MNGPELSPARRLALLEPPTHKVRIVVDTDTANEIDDQFAVVYALLSQDRIEVEAIYAVPFHNERSTGPEDGMLKSYDEILRVLAHLGRPHDGLVHKGSTHWLSNLAQPVDSPAVADLIARARAARDAPFYVVALGAITNVASAILTAPEIIEHIVLIWLGGNPHYWHPATEFNVVQDMLASRLVFDSGVPLVHVPCRNVTEHLRTTQPEVERFVKGRGTIGDYLFQIYSAVHEDHFAYSRVLWDVGPIAWLVNPSWVNSILIPSPILTTDETWSHDPYRHLIREARSVERDAIFRDLFQKLAHFSPLPVR
ncbi:MAG: nucleoside hydrolase [Chloroflexota bacterium]|nr:nucleoside hydrolase [Chloroflexota bacterium]